MSGQALHQLLRGSYCAFLIYVFGVAFTAMFSPLLIPDTSFRGVTAVAFGFALFGFPVIAPVAVVSGFALAFSVTRSRMPLFSIAAIALCAGFAASWLFQWIRPFDFYHESDGSHPGWEPVHMASTTTVLALLVAFASITGASFLVRRFTR